MAEFKQQHRLLAIDTPLGDDVLLLTRLEGEEQVSALFSFDIELYSKRKHIGPDEIVGQNVTLKLMTADEHSFMQGRYRYLNGYVRSFRGEGQELQSLRCYRAEIVPWLWFLTQTSDSKIFQDKTVKEIATELFEENGFSDYQFKLAGQHPRRGYCVQYQESDFNFLSRLFEEEGIYYYFTHEAGKHTLIISDHIGGYSVCDEASV
ncbi:MAG: type VI secretion system tip protein VgrG, partial [Chromatiales bacterium]|nr:type VI secretion system tip protein VgrG [Chromatiales bacterium]